MSTRSRPALAGLDGVETVHDLHVWPLSTTETALTAHLVAPDVASTDDLLAGAADAPRSLQDRALHAADRTRPPRGHAIADDPRHASRMLADRRAVRSRRGAQSQSRAGKPLLVRYDLDAAERTLTRDSIAGRRPGMWKWRELLPLPDGASRSAWGSPKRRS